VFPGQDEIVGAMASLVVAVFSHVLENPDPSTTVRCTVYVTPQPAPAFTLTDWLLGRD
jgi:hypothetical protein